MPDLILQPRSALHGVIGAARPPGGGVSVAEIDAEVVSLTSGARWRPALRQAFREAYGTALPEGPKAVRAGDLTLIGLTPRSFLAVREGDAPREGNVPHEGDAPRGDGAPLADELEAHLGTLGAVTDQSGGQVVLALRGPSVREVFAKGFTIDLHPDVFQPGDAATTTCAHVGVTLWRGEDMNGHPVYRVAMLRSYALSFWHWLVESAAAYGLSTEGDPDGRSR